METEEKVMEAASIEAKAEATAIEAEATAIEALVKTPEEAESPVKSTDPTTPITPGSSKRKRRKELSLGDKVKLIHESTISKKSHRYLAGVFNIGKTTVHDILKNKDRILNAYKNGDDSRSRKRIRIRYGNDEINKLTWHWYEHKRSHCLPVTGPNIQAKAREFAEQFDAKDFRASNGWLESFKKRYDIHFGVVETFGLSAEKSWRDTLQEVTDAYRPNDIYTLQEIGLLFRAFPDKACVRCVGSTIDEINNSASDRLTILLCCNMSGEFEIPVVVGKSVKSPDLQSSPVIWKCNKRAWITSIIFEKWLNEFDCQLRNEDRHVVLFVNILTAHPPHLHLFNIKLLFYPTAKSQDSLADICPLSSGITDAFRLNYRKKVLLDVLHKLQEYTQPQDAKQVFQQIVEVHACKWIVAAINEIPPSKIAKSFESVGYHIPPLSDSLSSYSMAFTALNGEEPTQHVSGDLYTVYLHDNMPKTVTNVNKAVTEAEIQLLLNAVLSKLKVVDEPMTANEYVFFDSCLQATDDLSEGWEERLVEDFTDNHDAVITVAVKNSTATSAPDNVTTETKNHSKSLVNTYFEAIQLNKHLISFAQDKKDDVLLDLLQNVESHIYSRRLITSYQEAILLNKQLISFAQEEKNEELLNILQTVEQKLELAEVKRLEGSQEKSSDCGEKETEVCMH